MVTVHRMSLGIRVPVVTLALLLGGAGCASSPCKIRLANPSADLSKYKRCYVAEAKIAEQVVVPADVLASTDDGIASELRGRGTFEEVAQQAPDAAPYLRVSTTYTKYRPGSRALRFLLIGLGSADLRMQVDVSDGRTGETLASGSVHEFWGWGGLAGLSRGIEDMQKNAVKNVGKGIDKACRAKERV